MYYVYVLKSKKNGELYIGSTNNLKQRFHDHNSGRSFATRRYLPWKLVYYEAYSEESLARMREKKLKYHGQAIRELKKRIFSSDHLGFIQHHSTGAGFTLMELLVVIVILGVLITLGGASFRGSQVKGRDGRRKTDLRNISLALEQYYTDRGQYPADNGSGKIVACGSSGTTVCEWGTPFIDQNSEVYMLELPIDPIATQTYYYDAGSQNKSFQLYAYLENTQDGDIITPTNANARCKGPTACNYGIASSATLP